MGIAEKPYRSVHVSDLAGGVACAGLIFTTTRVHAGYKLIHAATVSASSPVRDPRESVLSAAVPSMASTVSVARSARTRACVRPGHCPALGSTRTPGKASPVLACVGRHVDVGQAVSASSSSATT